MANEESLIKAYREAPQRHADYYFEELMTDGFTKDQLQADYENLQLALRRLKSGEVESEHTAIDIEDKLASYDIF